MRVLITGANRGIGLEFARRCVERGDTVYATVRDPQTAFKLQLLGQGVFIERLKILTVNVNVESSVRQAAEQVDALEILINNAAINPETPPYETFGSLQADALADVLRTNSIAPLLMAQAFYPALKKGQNPRIINLSSEMASLTDKDYGGSYAYSMSKAALNMATRALAADLKRDGITVISLDPGWVRTDMGGPTAPLSVEESVRGCLRVIDNLKPKDSGRFLNHAGRDHRW